MQLDYVASLLGVGLSGEEDQRQRRWEDVCDESPEEGIPQR